MAAACMPCAGAEAAGPVVVPLAGYVDSRLPPQLGVDARGGAVVAWSQAAYVSRGARSRIADTVFAAVRPEGGGVGRARQVSDVWLGMRSYALAVGSRGHGAIVWQSDTVRQGRLFFHALGRDGTFGRQVPVPGSRGASEPAAAIDARGRLLVAWLRASNRDRCGMVVFATVATADGGFGRARPVSEPCAHAGLVRVALARTGDGAVAWRSAGVRGPLSDSHVAVAPYAAGRFAAPRTVSSAPRVGFTLDLAAGGRRALVVWRDRGTLPSLPGVRGRVLTAAIDGEAVGPPVEVLATPERMLDDVDVAMSAHDAAIICWEQAPRISFEERETRGLAAVRRSAFAPFDPPEVVVTDRESGGGDLGLRVAIDRAGHAIAIYEGNYVERRPAAGGWRRRIHPRRHEKFDEGQDGGSDGSHGAVALSDGGEAVATWLLNTDDASYVRAAVIASR